jgi:hypothetical protein
MARQLTYPLPTSFLTWLKNKQDKGGKLPKIRYPIYSSPVPVPQNTAHGRGSL